ncbi:MAG: DUF2336 domain-containing protein [Sphingomicrobium sp.]
MMPVDWPLAAPAADHPIETARPRAGRDRLAIVRADFFLDEGGRLTDEERSLMAAMLRGLVSDITDEIIAGLPPLLAARAEVGRDAVYRRLRDTGLLERDGLVALLLRRADEQQLSARMERGPDAFVAAMVGDEDAAVAEAAMALTVARGRRRDRFGRLGVEYDDLAAEDAVALVHAVAAALREDLDREGDLPLESAAQALVARHDEGRRLDVSVAALARAMETAGRADEAMVRTLSQHGDAALLVAMLARRAGIHAADAWAFFSGGDAMMLARLSGCDRATAAQILAAFDSLFGLDAPDRAIERYDRIDDDMAERCRRWMRLDPHYRGARDAIEAWNG